MRLLASCGQSLNDPISCQSLRDQGMRGQTKFAVAVGAVLVIAGIWYAGKGDKPAVSDTTATNAPVTDTPQADQPVSGVAAANDDRGTDGTPRPISEAAANSSGMASPVPRRIEETTSALPAGSDELRPQPAETHAPVPAMLPTELPSERAGLTVLPNVGTTALDRPSDLAANDDVPRNADRDARPAPPALPPIAPVEIVGVGTSTTKPATVTHNVPEKTVVEKPANTINKPLPMVLEKAADKPAEKPKPRQHVVQAGDTYTSIAVKYFGHAKFHKDIMKANPGRDPTRLPVGVKLVIPEPPAGTAVKSEPKVDGGADVKVAVAPKIAGKEPRKETFVVPPVDPSRSYTVQPGEGWYDLARKFMGDGKNYPELYEYNKERVGGDPHLLRAGTVIELPPKAKLPAKTSGPQPATPPAK
jgi:nucleoid-associated protein YgaU